jgi:hypothetical protein
MAEHHIYQKQMTPEESGALFSDGDHQWNLIYRAIPLGFIAARSSNSMPYPQRIAPQESGIEEIMVAIEASDNNVYTGTATRYFEPITFDTQSHKVVAAFMLGQCQDSAALDTRMSTLGFKKREAQ